MSAREFTEWRAYERLDGPIGSERLDYLAAMLAQRITEMLQSGGKRPTIKQFYPKWDREEIVENGES
jgi:hypothetical protein